MGSPGRSIPVDPATNRLIGMQLDYDAAGNLTSWNGNTYDFGPFGEVWRVVTSNQEWLHAYTAQDERLLSWQVGGAEKIRWTLRGLDNQVLREFVYDRPTATGVVERDNVHRGVGGPLLMSQSFSTGPMQQTHFHVDHLGTPRLLTDHAGAQVAFHAYYPYGEEATDPEQNEIRYKFTGHERDLAEPTSTADDLDHMHARMTNPQLGRFLSVDPVQQLGRAQRMPQVWNRYSYAIGNPLKYVDPTGESDEQATPTTDKGNREGLFQLFCSLQEWFLGLLPKPPAADPDDPNVKALMEVYGEAKEHPTNLAGNVQQGLIEGTAELAAGATTAVIVVGAHLAARAGATALRLRPDVVLSGGRSGQLVKSLTGPASSAVRGGPGRVFVTNDRGQVVLDITRARVKPVTPGRGFGPKRAPTTEELNLLESVFGGGG